MIMLVGAFGLTMQHSTSDMQFAAPALEAQGHIPTNYVPERQEQRENPVSEAVVEVIEEQKTAASPVIYIEDNNVVPVEIEDSISVGEIQQEETANNIVINSVAASTEPLRHSFTSSATYRFRTTITITNESALAAQNITVSVPKLENNSPYQTTTLINDTILPVAFALEPYEVYTAYIDYEITVKTLTINDFNNPVIKQIETYYNKHKGSGNCRVLALAFIAECQANGIKAREVVGYTRPQRGNMTSGTLSGTRHSWAEVYIDDLGWMPVDLTFGYFIKFPHTSHIVEGYSDKNVKINYNGGSLQAQWSHEIL